MTDEPATDDPGRDPAHPDRALVEDASAFVDGALSPEDAARVAADSRLAALTAHFSVVRQHLGHAVDVDAAVREQHLITALAAFDVLEGSSDQARVHSLEAARQRRARRLAPVLAAAAAIVVVGLVIGSLATHHSGRDSLAGKEANVVDAATTARTEASANPPVAASSTADTTGTAGARPLAPSTNTPANTASDAQAVAGDGSIATDGLFTASSAAQLPAIAAAVAEARSSYAAPLPPNPCPTLPGVAAANIVWIERPAMLFLLPSIEQATNVVVVDPATCAVEASASLGG